MSFVGGSAVPLGHVNSLNYTLDIVAVPAIFADPQQTWSAGKDQWLGSLSSEIQGARTLLYDHLLPEERRLEIKPRSHPEHRQSAEKLASAHDRLQNLGFAEWGSRLVLAVQKQRNSPALRRRPIIFICHSTGGIVVKQALSSRLQDGADIAACCLWIAFLSTPHRGSSVLSDQAFAQTIRHKLGLKWEIGGKLRSQLAVPSSYLDDLNDRFCSSSALGIQISSYVETEELELEVLMGSKGEDLTMLGVTVVDPHSAELATSNAPVEEDMFYPPADHVNIATLANDPATKKAFVEDMKIMVRSTDSLERAAHHELIEQIVKDVPVDVHRFYEARNWNSGKSSTRIWSGSTSLQSFLTTGPSQVHRKTLGDTSSVSHKELHLGELFVQPIQPRKHTPAIVLDPSPPVGDSISISSPSTDSAGDQKLLAKPAMRIDESVRHSSTLQAPTKKGVRFTWTHIPISVTGWVEPVMKAISKDKGILELPSKLMTDQLWKLQHNRSRHASHHSRFVRPLCKVLGPKDTESQDELLSPSSAVDDLQLVLFLPYLHWDTFRSLKKRNEIAKRRNAQDHVRPVANDVLKGSSLEHKVIWQFLGSTMPVHCRRTLDGYGYPSLANTDARDMDQVMFKRTSRSQVFETSRPKRYGQHFSSRLRRPARYKAAAAPKVDEDNAYVLMVDELWLWILNNDTMVTFATPKEKEPGAASDAHLEADLRAEVLKDVGGDFARQVDDCFDHAALMVFHATRALLEEAEDPALNVFKTFEEHISEIAELHTVAFKQFRDSHKISDPKQLLGGSHNLDYSADLDNLLELRDVEDELNTIKKLFVEQRRIIADMKMQYIGEVNPRGKGLHGTMLLRESENTLSSYVDQIESMIKSSQIAQSAFENLLDLKQKHSNIVEAHMTRFQTETASEQAKSVMIFTIITIIFLPLSFFSSAFGMNVSDWSGVPTNLSLTYVLTVMGGISVTVVAVALAAAFNSTLRSVLRRILRKRVAKAKTILLQSPFESLRRIGSKEQATRADLEKGIPRSMPPFPQRPATAGATALADGMPSTAWRAPTDESEMSELWKHDHAE